MVYYLVSKEKSFDGNEWSSWTYNLAFRKVSSEDFEFISALDDNKSYSDLEKLADNLLGHYLDLGDFKFKTGDDKFYVETSPEPLGHNISGSPRYVEMWHFDETGCGSGTSLVQCSSLCEQELDKLSILIHGLRKELE